MRNTKIHSLLITCILTVTVTNIYIFNKINNSATKLQDCKTDRQRERQSEIKVSEGDCLPVSYQTQLQLKKNNNNNYIV